MKYTYEDVDERIQKTKTSLSAALIELIKKKEKIKVLDICKSAHVTAMTYYHHFDSKEQLYEYTIIKGLQGVLPIPTKLKPNNMKHLVAYLISSFNDLVYKNKIFISAAIEQSYKFGYKYSFIDISMSLIRRYLYDEIAQIYHTNKIYVQIWCYIICGSLFYLIIQITRFNFHISRAIMWDGTKALINLIN